ncbi:hypothetical protein B9T50_04245 [Zymomonas mobilis subsp. mobilis]|nr:hypothetical protein B9T50_04245 [Zymomonas mobilis subsp. mobilis]
MLYQAELFPDDLKISLKSLSLPDDGSHITCMIVWQAELYKKQENFDFLGLEIGQSAFLLKFLSFKDCVLKMVFS